MKKIFFTLIITVSGVINYAQQIISPESQKAITEKLASEITKYYFDKNVAKSISDSLIIIKTQLKNRITTDNFIEIVNTALHKISNDNHLKLHLDIDMFKSYSDDANEIIKFEYERAKKINFGFTKVNVLDGNIGYIEIINFSRFVGEEVAQKIASAMNILESTNALIIDLRENMGGDGRVGEILETYFYPEENEIYYDSVSKTEKFRVLPFVSGKRYLNRPVYILTGLGTFSAAEGFANSMQKNKKAIIVGEKTKGGGNSGSSVPILDGFLCFIPTSLGVSDEEASVKPDFITSYKSALNYAKYFIYKEELNKSCNDKDKEIIEWNIKTSEYSLHLNDKYFTFNNNFIGNYESGRIILLKDGQPFLNFKNKDYKLAQINENEFIIEDNESTFGLGNNRLIFNENGFDNLIYFSGQLMKKYFKKN